MIFKILLTVFNQSYNCQTSHCLGRNLLPKPLLSLPSLWYLYILPRDWYYIQKGSKFLMCTLISLLKQYFLLLITFCTYFERCSNFEFEAVWIFYVIVSQCKWVSGVDTYEAEIAADSIIWELFARKSAECLNLRNSFITISRAVSSITTTSIKEGHMDSRSHEANWCLDNCNVWNRSPIRLEIKDVH